MEILTSPLSALVQPNVSVWTLHKKQPSFTSSSVIPKHLFIHLLPLIREFLHAAFVFTLLPFTAESWKLLWSFLLRALKDNELPMWLFFSLSFLSITWVYIYLTWLRCLLLTGSLCRDYQVAKQPEPWDLGSKRLASVLSVSGKLAESHLLNRACRHVDKPEVLGMG